MLDIAALERTFEELIRRHESLRTRFEQWTGRAVQVIEPARPFQLAVTDLSSLGDAAERETVVAAADAGRGGAAVRS